MSSLVPALKVYIQIIHALNDRVGKAVSWLTLVMVLGTFLIVVLRYALNYGSVASQECIAYMHALVFMLGVAYTLKVDGHVRVDIFYQGFSRRTKAWIDCSGVILLLLPVTAFIGWSSWDYVVESWKIHESSGNSGGLPGVFLIKSTLIITACLLALQGSALFLDSLLIALNLKPVEESN
ncbi:MAG: TRAP transporter small permease subunit [Methylicorpusculum sp.]|uniref:TRAP transporter small permease subunit n=2 Tax=Methylicorpusculum sp. TaxID=2713644 RepID=UPI002726B586|nr:TRAP transporter small permease subunit [Methylicorpusculum sp.]MDO8844010.1 TRAP transporter small permease subunit [Methylicorpusculum sp.]MDO8939075.1 TRAP transporter small permease subunit [Methylicorpusculum sp.]MDO9238793.1 TRAP transporter small permease subunit [Methylicorpusculum sp.]MDP2177570.1 TRAP transporter small permease subunit [Methylicorpusculum sp.]MDP2200933.1 TRAP transporter small permease subunit [Methylicorpusculum sp.]